MNMNKSLSLIVALLLLAGTSFGQKSQTVTKGSNIIGLGFGPGMPYHSGSLLGGAIRAHFEHGTINAGPGVITFGGALGFSFYNANYNYLGLGYSGRWTTTAIGVRAAWHCSWGVDKLDTYGGAAAGLRIDGYSSKYTTINDPNDITLYPYFGGFVGAAYYFKPKFGVFAEVGYDVSFVTAGIDFKFGK
jgi:hypothetical protein